MTYWTSVAAVLVTLAACAGDALASLHGSEDSVTSIDAVVQLVLTVIVGSIVVMSAATIVHD